MTKHKQIRKLEEMLWAIHEAQIDMASDGLAIDNYKEIVQNLQARYHSITGNYYRMREINRIKKEDYGKQR